MGSHGDILRGQRVLVRKRGQEKRGKEKTGEEGRGGGDKREAQRKDSWRHQERLYGWP